MSDTGKSNNKKVLGEEWFPVGEVSVESVRERSASSALPPHYYLHVWFARRPLVASRAAIACSFLPPHSNSKKVFDLLGLPSDINMTKIHQDFLKLKASGKKSQNPFYWKRAFKHNPTDEDLSFFHTSFKEYLLTSKPIVLDPMAGGGSIPFEAIRLGLDVIANDLNPVAFLCLKGTVEYPAKFGIRLIPAVREFCDSIHNESKKELEQYYPKQNGEEIYAYVWARTISCPNCHFTIPLSPNWWIVNLPKNHVAARPIVNKSENRCDFKIVENPQIDDFDPEKGTSSDGDCRCPSCNIPTKSDEIKTIAQEGKMGHQLYCVCTKVSKHKGRGKDWIYRAPTKDELEILNEMQNYSKSKIFIDNHLTPSALFPTDANDDRPIQYGMKLWKDMFNFRQLLSHSIYLKHFRNAKNKLFQGIKPGSDEWDFATAVTVYGALVFDSCVSYNTMLCRWDATRLKIVNAMAIQAFPFKWSYAEFDHSAMLWPWASTKTLDSLKELIELLPTSPGSITTISGNAQSLPCSPKSVDSIVTDPPYSDNVMYAEISDFFYVWLKLLVGDLFPQQFKDDLTNKTDEAVANTARFANMKRGQARKLADQDYAAKMEAAFREMHRVLKDDGVLCVMFTHRKAEAWEGLAESIMNAGFTFRASWPVHTEPNEKFGKTKKGALKVTVILYCRKRLEHHPGRWEDMVDEIRENARTKVEEYRKMGISGPDLLVSIYGPALGVFSDYYPVKDVSGKIRRSGDALTIVAEVVNEFLTGDIKGADMETLAYLNLLRNFPGLEVESDLARISTVFGGNTSVDTMDVKSGRGLVQKKGGTVKILTAKKRIELGVISVDRPATLHSLMDVVHASIILYERQGIGSVQKLLQETGRDTKDAGVLSVLRAISSIGEAGSDDLMREARIANALLEALGQKPEGVLKQGEKITNWF